MITFVLPNFYIMCTQSCIIMNVFILNRYNLMLNKYNKYIYIFFFIIIIIILYFII